MPEHSHHLPFTHLFGEELENFYQLGQRDRDQHADTLHHIRSLFHIPIPGINTLVNATAEALIEQLLQSQPATRARLSAYAEGLDRPTNEVAFAFLLPEIMSSISKWHPGSHFGCSSFFTWDQDRDSPIHGRILDFPILGSWDKQERALLFESQGRKIFSFGSHGFPYPSLTAMSDAGVTLAIHQKFTNVFNPKGTPIFDLAYQLLLHADSIESAIEFLEHSTSITTWAFYMLFKNGDILRADLMGDHLYFVKDKVVPGKVLYVNNLPESPQLNAADFPPWGFEEYCLMRKKSAQKRILTLQRSKHINEAGLFKAMAGAHDRPHHTGKSWLMSPVTPSTLSVSIFNPLEGSASYLLGDAPKHYQGEYLKFNDIWGKPAQQLARAKAPAFPVHYVEGQHHWARAQAAHDLQDIHSAYHHLQIAKDLLCEQSDGPVVSFFFCVFQYLHAPGKNYWPKVLSEIHHLKNDLPPYLTDHAHIMISRLERLIYHKSSISMDVIANPHLKKVLEREQKIPILALHQLTKLATVPKMEIADIIYLY